MANRRLAPDVPGRMLIVRAVLATHPGWVDGPKIHSEVRALGARWSPSTTRRALLRAVSGGIAETQVRGRTREFRTSTGRDEKAKLPHSM